jgi:hypothetical protein
MKTIQLTQNQVALVDDDFKINLKWHTVKIRGKYYAKSNNVYMHHLVIGKPSKGFETDHIDGNGLNNQKDNLRNVTHRQNQLNRKSHRDGRLPGTVLKKDGFRSKPWAAQVNGKRYGHFATEQEAHEAYLLAIIPDTINRA